MMVAILILAALIPNVAPFNFESPESISCEVGDVIQNGQITCTCTHKQVYECIYKKTLNNKPDQHSHRHTCQPNKMYVEDSTTCICNYNGTWPHSTCDEVFSSLPTEYIVKAKCQPNGYVFIGCNVCRCDSKGYIDKSRCTQNDCQESAKSPKGRRSSKVIKQVFGNCVVRNWYSMAPCQFCFCLNENKLVCNTGKHGIDKLQLGTYSLFVCGEDLIKDAIGLIPNDFKLLRQGDKTINTESSKTNAKSRFTVVNSDENNRLEKDVTQEEDNGSEKEITQEDAKSQEIEGNENNYNHNEIAPTQSAEEKADYVVNNQEGPQVGRTELPYDEDYQSKELREEEEREAAPAVQDDEADASTNNEVVDPGLEIPDASKKDSEYQDNRVILQNLEDIGRQFKENLPMMLDKVFQMALRKSMVTIDKNSHCTPGAVTTVKCNTCFCMKNSKLLCTNNKCN